MRYLILTLTLALLAGCARDDSDPPNGRSGMDPLTDAKTGCQYFVVRTVSGGIAITPRLGRDGKPMCGGV